jgi:hypothetical protein
VGRKNGSFSPYYKMFLFDEDAKELANRLRALATKKKKK